MWGNALKNIKNNILLFGVFLLVGVSGIAAENAVVPNAKKNLDKANELPEFDDEVFNPFNRLKLSKAAKDVPIKMNILATASGEDKISWGLLEVKGRVVIVKIGSMINYDAEGDAMVVVNIKNGIVELRNVKTKEKLFVQ